jgi:murein DD-endopeptidase MepM/ murein hydrolase activator NlpD
MLLFTFTPHTPTRQAEAAGPLEHVTEVDDLPSRHTPITRAERASEMRYLMTAAGDTYGAMAITRCGNFNAWHAIQQANGWPERRIPVGARATIVCTIIKAPPATTPAPKPKAKPATAPIVSGAAWVHPLASGKVGNSCYRTSRRPGHNGVDIAQPKATPIRAVSAGTVSRKAYQSGGAGYHVTIKHAGGIWTRYHHMTGHSPLNVGAAVQPGTIIGYVGITGNATGYHLHFEVMRTSTGSNVNPAAFMRQHGVNIGC